MANTFQFKTGADGHALPVPFNIAEFHNSALTTSVRIYNNASAYQTTTALTTGTPAWVTIYTYWSSSSTSLKYTQTRYHVLSAGFTLSAGLTSFV